MIDCAAGSRSSCSASYGAIAAQVYGLLMNMSGWPFGIAAAGTELSYVPGGGFGENLHRFLIYTLTTSSLGWDMGRAITNVVLIALVGPAVLAALRRASRKARFGTSDHSPGGNRSSGVTRGSPQSFSYGHQDQPSRLPAGGSQSPAPTPETVQSPPRSPCE